MQKFPFVLGSSFSFIWLLTIERRGAGGSGDSSWSTDSVVPGLIPWETG